MAGELQQGAGSMKFRVTLPPVLDLPQCGRTDQADVCSSSRGEGTLTTAGQASPEQTGCFHPDLVSTVPEPARRYLLHAIAPGTPLASRIELEMGGRIRLSPAGKWMPFHARQEMSREGFVWKASAGRFLRIAGEDRYLQGEGTMVWKLWGLVPVVSGSGPNITRAARGRFVAEAAVFLPSVLLPQNGTRWRRVDDETAEATVDITGVPVPLLLSLGSDGRLRKIVFSRWGNVGTDDGSWTTIPFGVTFSGERTFGGCTLPTTLTASWWVGTNKQFDFFEAGILSAKFDSEDRVTAPPREVS